MACKLTVDQANEFLGRAFHSRDGRGYVISLEEDRAVVRLDANERHLRPGGYISGPTQMGLADTASYMAVMTRLGITPMTVTSNLNINFMRPCIGDTVIADGRLMKLGKTLALIEVDIRIEGAAKAASHAIVTYAVPAESAP